jgi:hypothetical protein
MAPEDIVEGHNGMIIDAVHVPAVPLAPVVPSALVVPPAAVAPPALPAAPARAAAAAPAPSSLSLALVPVGLSPAKCNRSDGSLEDGNIVSMHWLLSLLLHRHWPKAHPMKKQLLLTLVAPKRSLVVVDD